MKHGAARCGLKAKNLGILLLAVLVCAACGVETTNRRMAPAGLEMDAAGHSQDSTAGAGGDTGDDQAGSSGGDATAVDNTGDDSSGGEDPQPTPAPGGGSGDFQETGGVLIMEVESAPLAGSWEMENEHGGYGGTGYYAWRGGNQYGSSGNGILSYPFTIADAGTYKLSIHNRRDKEDRNPAGDEENDVWVRLDGGSWTKLFSSMAFGQWSWQSNFDFGSNKPGASYDLSAGHHELQLSGRSENFKIDRIHLYKGSANPGLDAPESTRTNTPNPSATPPPPTPPPPSGDGDATLTGELRKWHRVTLTFDGPDTDEGANPNPFMDYRLAVTFTGPDGKSRVVPGFYAADGNAAESGATGGSKWQVHFLPGLQGTWTWRASFRTGSKVAIADSGGGAATAFDGAGGSFAIQATNKSGRDFRGKGALQYVNGRYLRFAETGDYFLKGGADSPENLLGYADFDGTYDTKGSFLHAYAPHIADWNSGDPTWQGGKGKGIIGALNYLSGRGMNSVYFMTYNIDSGDGGDVWPWTTPTEKRRFDVSKLAQWEIVFSHMNQLGIVLHMVTQETENDQGLDGGSLGETRKLYYRELMARFAHHPGVVINLGEENTNTDAQRKDFANYIRGVDPYDHPMVIHTYPGSQGSVYTPLLGFANLEGPSIQGGMSGVHSDTINWIDKSAAAGRPWVVTSDEIGPAGTGVKPDADDPAHDGVRHQVLWGNLMAGGAGVEYYFGYSFAHDDLDAEDWRSRETMWNQTRHALEFFQTYLPFTGMSHADQLTDSSSAYCLAKAGQVYAVYLPSGGSVSVDLDAGSYSVRWYNPRSGGALQTGIIGSVTGGGDTNIGSAPFAGDAVALVSRQ